MTETEEALATALVEGFNGVTDPDARQEKFTAEDFETHVRFLGPIVERLIALREAEARRIQMEIDCNAVIGWYCGSHHNYASVAIRSELERPPDALLQQGAPKPWM